MLQASERCRGKPLLGALMSAHLASHGVCAVLTRTETAVASASVKDPLYVHQPLTADRLDFIKTEMPENGITAAD